MEVVFISLIFKNPKQKIKQISNSVLGILKIMSMNAMPVAMRFYFAIYSL